MNRTKPAPTAASLHESALAYLGKRAATVQTLTRALERTVRRWELRSGEVESLDATRAREAIPGIVARLVEVGLVNDATFAANRAERLTRGGRSRRAITAHLAARGVASSVTREVLPDDRDELRAALVFARKRRIGPFTSTPADPTDQRALGAMARAGFSFELCRRALRMSLEEATEHLGLRDIL